MVVLYHQTAIKYIEREIQRRAMTTVEEEYLTTEEVAERLRIGTRTVLNWLNAGKLRGARLSGRRAGWRIRASEVDRFMREQEEATARERSEEDG
jgi:excisionase family DNA binding protein